MANNCNRLNLDLKILFKKDEKKFQFPSYSKLILTKNS